MTISKDFRFPVSVRWEGPQRVQVETPDVAGIEVTVPPEFRGPGGHWSPETLLVASAASCYAVTFAALAERRGIPIHGLTVSGTGLVGKRDDGRFGFLAVELTPRIQTEPECVDRVERTARAAHASCLVARALNVPIGVTPLVEAAELAFA